MVATASVWNAAAELVTPMMRGINWPVDWIVSTPVIWFHLMVSSMLRMNQAIMHSVKAFQQRLAHLDPLPL